VAYFIFLLSMTSYAFFLGIIVAPGHTLWHNHSHTHTLRRTPLNEESVSRRDLYLTTHNTHNRQTSTPRRGSKPQSQQASNCRPKR